MNYVVPGPWLLSNYYYYYFHRIDIALHQRLETPIAKSLLPILNTGWYAARGQSYAKRYSDLAALLFIPCWEHLSWVKKQLDPAHEELQEEKFLAAWEYETTPKGDWSHVIRWWPGEKWFFDQQEHQRRRNAVTGKNTTASQFLLLPPTMPEVKPSPSAPALTSEEDAPCWNRVREFYTAIGQEHVSVHKIREGVSTLAALEQEGYSTSDIDAALEWIVKHRKTRFGGDVHSIRLVIKVIGQALKEKSQEKLRGERPPLLQQMSFAEEVSDFRLKDTEALLGALSSTEFARIEERARRSLLSQGIQEKFLLKGLVRQEIVRLLVEKQEQAKVGGDAGNP